MSVLKNLRAKLDNQTLSSVELTRDYLENITTLNPTLNALITVCRKSAFLEAERADRMIHAGRQHFLTGIPLVHKDNFCTRGVLTSCGSKILSNFVPPYDATIVKKLKDVGMVTLGKANMDEFGMGSTSEHSFYGAVKNPHDPEYVSGGSSGGSAAAVSAMLAPIATGSDTGGSVRQPAAFTGLTGMKPSYGTLSRFGLIAYASSFDQAGVLGHFAEDVAYLLESMRGLDDKDGTSVDTDAGFFTRGLSEAPSRFRIGVDTNLMAELAPKAQDLMQNTITLLKQQGHKIQTIRLPDLKAAVSTYYILAPAEAATNLARFDGVRFGYRSDNAETLDDLYLNTRSEGFGLEVKRRIIIGNYVLAASQYDAYYHKAQQIRQKFFEALQQTCQSVDMILLPSAATKAMKIGAQQDPVSTYLSDRYTLIANLTGAPAISFPIGSLDKLPFGAQFMAKPFKDHLILNAVYHFQKESDFHLKRPNIRASHDAF